MSMRAVGAIDAGLLSNDQHSDKLDPHRYLAALSGCH
jgi:hypothetical protein